MKTTKLDKHAEIEEKEILHFVEKSNEKNYKGNPFQKLQAVGINQGVDVVSCSRVSLS